ncbi:MAG: hypothetical protein ACYSRP_09405 [Planctomycetota bacterium]|jgi:hypothetical protein
MNSKITLTCSFVIILALSGCKASETTKTTPSVPGLGRLQGPLSARQSGRPAALWVWVLAPVWVPEPAW